MASYNELNALIDAYINRNGVQAITGQILNGVLKAMVEQLGRGYTIMGVAIPTTDPGTPDGPECYFASETGTYTNFGGLQVVPGELALLCYTPTDGWTKETIYEGFQEVGATIDGNVGTPSVGVSYANGVLSFDFHNMKGNPGADGNDGAPAGFGTIAATVDGNIGTPGVTVQSSGPDTAKNITFAFTNLKGETGVTSVVATVDNTTGTPACTVSLVGQQLTLAFTGLKGAQGDTGSSVDYPFTIVNNLTTNDATQALSAAMGVQLEAEVSQLEAEVDEKIGFDTKIPSHDNGYSLNADGEAITNAYVSQRGVSDYIPVTGGGQVFIKSGVYQGGNSTYSYAAFYTDDNESSFVSREYSTTYSTEITNKTVNVPATANYMRVVLMDNTVPAVFGGFNGTVKQYVDGQISDVNDRIDNLPISVTDASMSDTSENAVQNKVIKSYIDTVTGYPFSYIPSKLDGYSMNSSGQAITNAFVAQRGVTDYIPVTGGGKLYVKSGAFQGGNSTYCSLAFYSSNDEVSFISCISQQPWSMEIADQTFDVPSSANYVRFVLKDYSIPVIIGTGAEKSIADRIAEILSASVIAGNSGKSIVVFGGSHTCRPESETAKDIWRNYLGMDVYTAGVGSTGIVSYITMYAWAYNGTNVFTRGGYNDGVGSNVWDENGYLSDLKITAIGETTITLSDGNTYTRNSTDDYVVNTQVALKRLSDASAIDKKIYLIWLSTNDYVLGRPIGNYNDYTEDDNFDTSKIWQSESNRGTVCGGFNNAVKLIRDANPTAEIYVFTSLRFFNQNQAGYNPFTTDKVGANTLNFYDYQKEIMKAAQCAGCAILDQFLLQGVDKLNYATYYQSDNLHLKASGYEKIGYIQADFLANGK